MGRHYQRGYLRCAKRKSGSYCWEFLWREDGVAGKRVRRTAVIGSIEQYPTKEEALDAVNGLRMRVNVDIPHPTSPTCLFQANFVLADQTSTISSGFSGRPLFVNPRIGLN